MREWNGRYRDDQRGACLVDLARRGRCRRRSRSPGHQRPRGLPERRGGRNNEYKVNRCISMHDMTSNDARRALTWYEVVPVKGGKHPGKYPRCFVFSGRGAGGGKLRVR